MNYYKEVGGKKLDGHLLEIADVAVAGAGDGRISKEDAEKMLAAVIDDDVYTAVEKATIDYIHKNYKWTEISKQHFAVEDVLNSEEEKISRLNDMRAATMETYQDHDDIGIIVRLANGRRVEVMSNFIELEEDFVELRGGFHIPLKVIEKVEI